MPDIHIQKGYRGSHVIVPTTEAGKRWIIENIKAVVEENSGEIQIPIASEYAEEIAEKIREDGVEVDVD